MKCGHEKTNAFYSLVHFAAPFQLSPVKHTYGVTVVKNAKTLRVVQFSSSNQYISSAEIFPGCLLY